MTLHAAALLTADECRAADQATIKSGTSGETLMENAGKAVVDLILQEYKPRPALVVCGTGNNGGDGFVVARMLKERNWQVTLAITGNADDIKDDAKKARDKWNMSGGATRTFAPDLLKESELVVDAIFGSGLDRNVEGDAKVAINAINDSKLPVVSIDMASGINTDTGAVMSAAIRAAHTVTFVRAKLGHVVLPGKAHIGELHIYDIGISGSTVKPLYFLNAPVLWKQSFPTLSPESHKYTRGHTVVVGGGINSTGAARLASIAALRIGSGLVSVACAQIAQPMYAMTLTSVMTKTYATTAQLGTLLEDKRITATLIGPGNGVSEATREQALLLLGTKKPCVIDADAISIFQPNPKALFSAISGPTVLTPHEGEFARLFGVSGPRTKRALEAAKLSNAVVVLKGNDTVIASPDGRLAVNANAPVWLATAGTGDVLAGMIAGLMAQGMPTFDAACAATWIHGEAATHFGPGLIAEDLPASIPAILKKLYHD